MTNEWILVHKSSCSNGNTRQRFFFKTQPINFFSTDENSSNFLEFLSNFNLRTGCTKICFSYDSCHKWYNEHLIAILEQLNYRTNKERKIRMVYVTLVATHNWLTGWKLDFTIDVFTLVDVVFCLSYRVNTGSCSFYSTEFDSDIVVVGRLRYGTICHVVLSADSTRITYYSRAHAGGTWSLPLDPCVNDS